MFPKGLAERVFSLCQGQAGNAISVSIVLDEEGGIAECGVTPSIVHPQRLTYDALDSLLLSASQEVQPELYALHQVCPSLAKPHVSLHVCPITDRVCPACANLSP